MKTFGEKLREARRARGMNQKEFSELLGVSNRMIIDYESGARRPHRKKMQEFADILELPAAYLLEDRFDDVLSVFNQDSSAETNAGVPDTAPADQPMSEVEAQARREIAFLKERSAALFAGGELPQDAKDAFFQSLYEAYLKCREQAVENDADVTKFGH